MWWTVGQRPARPPVYDNLIPTAYDELCFAEGVYRQGRALEDAFFARNFRIFREVASVQSSVKLVTYVPSFFPTRQAKASYDYKRLPQEITVGFVFRGTDKDLVGNLKADFELLWSKLFEANLPHVANKTCSLVFEQLKELQDTYPELLKHGRKFRIHVCGHSLGGFLSEVVTVVLSDYITKEGWSWSCTTFESPGLPAEFIELAIMQKPAVHWHSIMVTYLAAPNPINMLHSHLGSIKHVKVPFEQSVSHVVRCITADTSRMWLLHAMAFGVASAYQVLITQSGGILNWPQLLSNVAQAFISSTNSLTTMEALAKVSAAVTASLGVELEEIVAQHAAMAMFTAFDRESGEPHSECVIDMESWPCLTNLHYTPMAAAQKALLALLPSFVWPSNVGIMHMLDRQGLVQRRIAALPGYRPASEAAATALPAAKTLALPSTSAVAATGAGASAATGDGPAGKAPAAAAANSKAGCGRDGPAGNAQEAPCHGASGKAGFSRDGPAGKAPAVPHQGAGSSRDAPAGTGPGSSRPLAENRQAGRSVSSPSKASTSTVPATISRASPNPASPVAGPARHSIASQTQHSAPRTAHTTAHPQHAAQRTSEQQAKATTAPSGGSSDAHRAHRHTDANTNNHTDQAAHTTSSPGASIKAPQAHSTGGGLRGPRPPTAPVPTTEASTAVAKAPQAHSTGGGLWGLRPPKAPVPTAEASTAAAKPPHHGHSQGAAASSNPSTAPCGTLEAGHGGDQDAGAGAGRPLHADGTAMPQPGGQRQGADQSAPSSLVDATLSALSSSWWGMSWLASTTSSGSGSSSKADTSAAAPTTNAQPATPAAGVAARGSTAPSSTPRPPTTNAQTAVPAAGTASHHSGSSDPSSNPRPPTTNARPANHDRMHMDNGQRAVAVLQPAAGGAATTTTPQQVQPAGGADNEGTDGGSWKRRRLGDVVGDVVYAPAHMLKGMASGMVTGGLSRLGWG